MSALQAVVRPDGLEAIVGADDAAWLATEARKAKERVERYDGVDGAAAPSTCLLYTSPSPRDS